MDIQQQHRIRHTYALIRPDILQVAERFYAELFRLDPFTQILFKGSIRVQGRKFMSLIEVAVQSLDRLETLVEDLRNLGRHHMRIGVRTRDFETMRQALLKALAEHLGPEWTAEDAAAWGALYDKLAAAMEDARVIKAL